MKDRLHQISRDVIKKEHRREWSRGRVSRRQQHDPMTRTPKAQDQMPLRAAVLKHAHRAQRATRALLQSGYQRNKSWPARVRAKIRVKDRGMKMSVSKYGTNTEYAIRNGIQRQTLTGILPKIHQLAKRKALNPPVQVHDHNNDKEELGKATPLSV